MNRYGGQHQATRKAMLPYAEGQPCCRCGRPMLPGQPLDLDHTDDGTGYRGMAHARCNRAAGGQLGQARRRARTERIRLMLTECVLGVEISEDRRFVSLAGAGRLDADTVMVELASYVEGVAGAVPGVLAIQEARRVLGVCIDPHSPAATLIRPLTEAGVTVTELSTTDVVIAHGQFLDLLNAGRLRHVPSAQLDAAVRHGMQRRLGGAQTWDRHGAPVDIGPLTAATWATWGLLSRPAPQPFFATWR